MDIQCIDDTGAPYPDPLEIPASESFPPLKSAPSPHTRVFRFTFAPGWDKDLFFGEITDNVPSYPISFEWLNDTDLQVTYKPDGSNPAIAYCRFNTNVDGGSLSIWTQVESNGQVNRYYDNWTYMGNGANRCSKYFGFRRQ